MVANGNAPDPWLRGNLSKFTGLLSDKYVDQQQMIQNRYLVSVW